MELAEVVVMARTVESSISTSVPEDRVTPEWLIRDFEIHPSTWSLEPGAVVPMPTLPPSRIAIFAV
jgi:hypothetical protein